MTNKDLKKFLLKLLMFLSPVLVAWGIELFVLPIDFFTYRVWESLLVSEPGKLLLPGSFYPNMYLKKTEVGDSGAHTPYAIKKDIVWQTDAQGYRNTPGDENYDILLVGDSTVVGTGVTQSNTLGAVLSEKTGQTVYPIGLGGLKDVMFKNYFAGHSPKVVILASIERSIVNTSLSLVEDNKTKIRFAIQNLLSKTPLNKIQPMLVLADRMLKQNMYHYFQARVDNFFQPKSVLAYGNPPMLFLQGDIANKKVPYDNIEMVSSQLKEVSDYFESKGIKFIFLPIPNKETVYWADLPGCQKPDFLTELYGQLSSKGVLSVNTQADFELNKNQKNKAFYYSDESHLNPDGINEVADLIAHLLQLSKK